MPTISYLELFKRASQLCFGVSDPHREDAFTLNTFLNARVSEGWRAAWWPEWIETEQRLVRPLWSAAANYSAGAEVYFPLTGQVYQALKTSTNQPPGTLAGAGSVTNDAYWCLVQETPCGDFWKANVAVALAKQVRNADDDLVYRCHTAHTAGSSIDLTKFGKVNPFRWSFDRYTSGSTVIDAVKGVYESDPRLCRQVPKLKHLLTSAGVVIYRELPRPWMETRPPAPLLSGDAYDSTKSYAAKDQAFYGEDFWRARRTVVGVTPVEGDDWERVKIPYEFRDFVPRAVYGDWLASEGQHDKSARQINSAGQILTAEIQVFELDQGQTTTLKVRNQ